MTTHVAPDVLVFVTGETLTDGSKVFNVRIGNLVLHAYTEEDAEDLASEIAEAITDHATELADYIVE